MKKVIFVCHGNICRSPAAEYIFKKLIKECGRENEFSVTSRATSYEEIGNDIYPPMKSTLVSYKIPFSRHSARRITIEDYNNSDYIFYMDHNNEINLNRIYEDIENKYLPIYKWTPSINCIEEPWYTDNYEKVVNEITTCIIDILKNI